jgi:hypothetical protein
MCPKGNDPLEDCNEAYDTADFQVQLICLFDASDGDFAIKYNDYYGGSYTTRPLAYDASAEDVMDALLSLPDHAIDQIDVSAATIDDCDANSGTLASSASAWFVTFSGNQVTGKQHHLELMTQACGDGCQPKLTGLTADSTEVSITQAAETNMYECSRRGKCDYDSGICECFAGFTDEDCSVQSSLA